MRDSFFKTVLKISVPIALQGMLQASFSLVDQVMVGSLGSAGVAAVGIAGKFNLLYTVIIGAIVSVAGIMTAQFLGAGDSKEAGRGFALNTIVASGIGAVFTLICVLYPARIMGMYSPDLETVSIAGGYLRIISLGFVPYAVIMLISARMRCIEHPVLPLILSVIANAVNTLLDYALIFGRLGFSAHGADGAAAATFVSQLLNMVMLIIAIRVINYRKGIRFSVSPKLTKLSPKKYLTILLPMLAAQLLWSLSENVYASVYGHLGTLECAAMTLTYPIQGIIIAALSGLSQASGILIGKELGKGEIESAFRKSKKLLLYGFVGSVILSLLLVLFMRAYISLYSIDDFVRETARHILLIFALVTPVKVLNLILGGGIVKSGGGTRAIMVIEIIGAWGIGVPLALLGGYVRHLDITMVYLILSLEECVRLILSWIIFVNKRWMRKI